MKISYNPDKELVNAIKKGLEKSGGYCPCRREKTEDNKCMCKEFREQIADPDFEGYCHCMLYYKEKQRMRISVRSTLKNTNITTYKKGCVKTWQK